MKKSTGQFVNGSLGHWPWVMGHWSWVILFVAGCASRQTHAARLPNVAVWGKETTATAGNFVGPRAVAVDDKNDWVYVVDSSGRIQKFTRSGKFLKQWSTPSVKKGKPEGLALTPERNLVVTDTHYSRVLIYSPDGKLLKQFGSYGNGESQFVLATGVAVNRQGNIYVADYNGSPGDGLRVRVHKFDSTGKFLLQWGGYGESPGKFQRLNGIAVDNEDNVVVADIVNHRIQVFTPQGKLIRYFGKLGKSDGELTYPYGVAVGKDGNIYVAEWGNCRVQKFTAEGQFIAKWGGVGRAPGKLAHPWGLAVDEHDYVYVADTENDRVQRFRM
jgi:DNA-binding beta-propeller fold protein YncE